MGVSARPTPGERRYLPAVPPPLSIGTVAIGRNEGQRLKACLESLRAAETPFVYVDSGSTDGSGDIAGALGIELIALDSSSAFTAARARNAGAARLFELFPALDAIQFIDGDCSLQPGWISAAAAALAADDRVAVVWGRRRERFPEASIYNRLCDLDWDEPIGESAWFGGDALIRRSAFQGVDGYDATVIAGEEPELAARLRKHGWRILRIDHEATLHDANLTRFCQWWKRMVRGGHAMAEVAHRHDGWGGFSRRQMLKAVGWAIVPIPLAGMLTAIWGWWGLLPLASYFVLWLKVLAAELRRGRSLRHSALRSTFLLLGKWPETLGVARYWLGRFTGRRSRIIEYKGPGARP